MQPQPNLPQSDPYHPEHHIKVYVWIALVVVAFLVAINGYLYFLRLAYYQEGARTAQETEQKIQELRVKRESGLSPGKEAALLDWKTYRNEEYGFEFRYPNDWKEINTTTDAAGIFWINFNLNLAEGQTHNTLYVKVFPSQNLFSWEEKIIASNSTKTEIFVNNIKVNYYGNFMNIPTAMLASRSLFIEIGAPSYPTEEDQLEKIISTFRFIDSVDGMSCGGGPLPGGGDGCPYGYYCRIDSYEVDPVGECMKKD